MTAQKLSLAALILFSLSACSSGGSSANNEKPQTNPTQQAQTELDSFKSALAKANQDLASAQSELSKAKTALQQAQTDLTKALSDKNTTADQLAQAKARLANAEKAQESAENKLSSANRETQSVKSQLNSANNEMQAVQNQLNSANSEMQTVQNQLNSANTDLVKAKNDLQQAQADLAKAQADKNTTAEQLAAAEKAKAEAEIALQNKNEVMREIVRKAAEITNERGRDYSRIDYTYLPSLPQGWSKHAFISMSAENLDGIFVGDHYIYVTPDATLVSRDNKAFWDSATPRQSSFRV